MPDSVLSLHFMQSSVSLCRELNEINRKHIQDSVALIRGVNKIIKHSDLHSVDEISRLLTTFSAILINLNVTLCVPFLSSMILITFLLVEILIFCTPYLPSKFAV